MPDGSNAGEALPVATNRLRLRVKTQSNTNPAELKTIITQIDASIASFLDGCSLTTNLDEAIRYAVLGGGKRLRPVLAWRAAEACGRAGACSIPAGIAVELIHAFSLVHDDLPAMDDDDLRRGRPTLHIQSGEAMAILAGDAMLTLAFEVIMDPSSALEESARPRLLGEVCAGTRAMIVGQVHDTLGGMPESLSEEEKLQLIHRNKTGALISAACRMGAICADADENQLASITEFSEAIGLQFQVVDDLLDAEGDAATVGKATGKDIEAGKLTYPSVLGIAGSRKVAADLHDRAMAAAQSLGPDGAGLVGLLEKLTNRQH
ncbi:MAG: polyprenyl synthetase family protein [Phycisphaerales bacterium]|nr:polyprenyl synthetase family protein [Phycisphaerales bacterium]